jgi:nucleoside-diphosphate-sugar epimerase
MILVTGAAGHIGRAVSASLRNCQTPVLPVDILRETLQIGGVRCDLRRQDEIAQLFESHAIDGIIHAAAVLPTAFGSDPIAGAETNLNGSIHLLQQAVHVGVRRFVFVSSMSVYGSIAQNPALTEDISAIPDEPYGGTKRAIELVGEALQRSNGLEFISLRVARVIGSGSKSRSSPWRSQIFERPATVKSIRIPFAPNVVLSLVHVDDVAQMLTLLARKQRVEHSVYNTPVELWNVADLKAVVENHVGVAVELGYESGGPCCDGTRFAREFGFQVRGLEDRLMCRTD